MFEKLEKCPRCGAEFNSISYDFQQCPVCKWDLDQKLEPNESDFNSFLLKLFFSNKYGELTIREFKEQAKRDWEILKSKKSDAIQLNDRKRSQTYLIYHNKTGE